MVEFQDDSCSWGLAYEACYGDPEGCLLLFSRLHEVAYGVEQFRVCWPTLLRFSGPLWRSDAVPPRLPIKPFEEVHHETWTEERFDCAGRPCGCKPFG